MKKLFAILSILSCISLNTSATVVSAEVENTCNQNTAVSSNQDSGKEVTIPANPTSFPYVISVDAPSGTVVGVSGPSRPDVKWNVEGGKLYIYLYKTDFLLLEDNNPIIEVATDSSVYYIKIKVSY